MQVELSPQAEATLKSLLATGVSPEQVVESAIEEMAQRVARQRLEANEGIRQGLADLGSGQTESWAGFIAGFREEHGFTPNT